MAHCEINLLGSSKINTLIRLIDKYKDELPIELISLLKELSGDSSFEYSAEDINTMMYKIDWQVGNKPLSGEFVSLADGNEIKGISAVNSILKTVRLQKYKNGNPEVLNGVFICDTINPESLSLTYDGFTLIKWDK